MKFHEYLLLVAKEKECYGRNIRLGQAYFNVLRDHFPDFAQSISGSDIDPFDHDKRINLFLKYVNVNWPGNLPVDKQNHNLCPFKARTLQFDRLMN